LDHAKDIVDKYILKFMNSFYLLNKFQIKKHKKEEYSPEEKVILNDIAQSDNDYEKFGALILLDDYIQAENVIESLKKKIPMRELKNISNWPIIKSFLIPNLNNKKIFDTQTEVGSNDVTRLSA